jgi:hypothetical protein
MVTISVKMCVFNSGVLEVLVVIGVIGSNFLFKDLEFSGVKS